MTDEIIEFDPVDGSVRARSASPASARSSSRRGRGRRSCSVLVEKEQVALLATEAEQFLDRIAEEDPEGAGTFGELPKGGRWNEDEPLFRARLIGIGFDPERQLVLIELREHAAETRRGAAAPSMRRAKARAHRAVYATRAQVPGDARRRRGRGLGGPAHVPVLRLPDGSGRAHLPAQELTA